ncbi:MAG: glycosyltransferase family 4 protein [Balneolaceae bacterium]|nr:glycosyltransferase family 4 protein [Balneolaceae bacterium]
MKILYISHLHPPKNAPLKSIGGMQRVSMQLVDELKKKPGVQIKTIIQHAPWKGIEARTAVFLFKLIRKLPKIVDDYQPDVILFSSMVTATLAKFTRSKISVPMVTINHGQDVKMPIGIYQNFVPKVFEALDGVISVSRATREECIKRGMHPEKGIALPNGFDMAHIEETPEKESARKDLEKAFGFSLEGKKLLLTVGRQVKRKGHEWFITDVFSKIKSDVIYLAIGEGPEHERLLQVRDGLTFKDALHFVGKQPDELLRKSYAAADVFVMPNIPVEGDMEGFGIVMLEANLASTPAVAADLEGIKDVISDGENGFKVEVRDADTFAAKIDEVLTTDYSTLSESSRNYVEQNFAWERVADRYISYLGEVIKDHSTHNG